MNFVKTVGSTTTLRHKDKINRLQAAMTDLQVAIRGCSVVDPMETSQFLQSVESLACSCAMFLRKTVIGDRGDRRTRLLDDETCRALGLEFNPVRPPAGEGETFEIIAVDIRRGVMEIVPVDEVAKSHGGPYVLPFGPQKLTIAIEWPLPGTLGWTRQPTDSEPWQIRSSTLFDTQGTPALDCDGWLGQQLVMVNDRGVSLGEVIRLTANTEAAHAPYMARMMTSDPKGEPHVPKNIEAKILSGLVIAGVHYHHIVVIESALHLYESLDDNDLIKRPAGDRLIPILCLVPDVFSVRECTTFDGGLALSFSTRGQANSYRIRPTN